MKKDLIRQAAQALAEADALLVGAGAGMGVDSGLPDFRGDKGFWKAYPPFEKLGYSFIDMANPAWFEEDPRLAWGFYGHRLNLYRDTTPHDGFRLLREWGEKMSKGCFVYTSNVDGQFSKAGFADDDVYECHGSIHYMQGIRLHSEQLWHGSGVEVEVDEDSFRAVGPLPTVPNSSECARPNILMFGDWHWNEARAREQEERFVQWVQSLSGKKVVAVECGAGTAIPSVRRTCERVVRASGGTLIRINPREAYGPDGTVSLEMGALEALSAIQEEWGSQ